jgi:hypothetical protein
MIINYTHAVFSHLKQNLMYFFIKSTDFTTDCSLLYGELLSGKFQENEASRENQVGIHLAWALPISNTFLPPGSK